MLSTLAELFYFLSTPAVNHRFYSLRALRLCGETSSDNGLTVNSPQRRRGRKEKKYLNNS